jgi:hypothetical protein
MSQLREDGSASTFVVRYPDGSSEYRMSQSNPQVGDIVAGRGQSWLVARVAELTPGTLTVSLRQPATDG